MQRNIKAVDLPAFHVKHIEGVSTRLAYDCKPAENNNQIQSLDTIIQPMKNAAAEARRQCWDVIKTPTVDEAARVAALLEAMKNGKRKK